MSDDGAPADLRIEPLTPRHDRDAFSSGVDALDRYLKTQASQDVRRRANGVFVMVSASAGETVLGYFTLCATTLPQGDVPAAVRKHVPRYPLVSATLLGRLAVAQTMQGKGLGAVLLADALRRTFAGAASIGSSMLVVDAIDARAERFYEAFGFQRLPESNRLILPMHTIERMLAEG